MNNTVIFAIIVYMFFSSGIFKLLDLENTSLGFISKLKKIGINFVGLLPAKFIIILAALLQILASLAIVYASTNTKKFRLLGIYSSLSLVIFTVLATLLYHFPPLKSQYYPFISNVTTCGGLLLIANNFYR